jgi:hypothetical protein
LPVVLSTQTASKLRDHLNASPPSRGGVAKGGGVRHVTFIEVTSAVDGYGYYDCLPCDWLGELEEWEYHQQCLCREPNGGTLTVGEKYLALNAGTFGGVDVYLTAGCPSINRPYPLDAGCLVRDDYGEITGIAQRWVQTDGSVQCVETADCECLTPSPPPPPPPPPGSSSSSSLSSSSAMGGGG